MGLVSTPVKQLSEESNLPLYQTKNVNSKECLKFLTNLHPDLLCVVAFGQILSQQVLSIPKIMCINLHASLLPKYRGAAPIRWAIIKGEIKTGLTIIKVVRQLDAGPIILQREVTINDNDDAFSLEEKLTYIGSDLILEALGLIQSGKYNLIIQDDKKATLASKLKKEDGLIVWGSCARDIFNLIRGCVGWPGAFTYFRSRVLKIHKASLHKYQGSPPVGSSPGEVLQISKNGIVVATGQGYLLIEQLQSEGKKITKAIEFVSGYRISVGESLGEKN
jgi:methionyl-tRNA formyltransferase